MMKLLLKKNVRDTYGKSSQEQWLILCGSNKSSSCGCSSTLTADDVSKNLGYSDEELKNVPEGQNLGLGCGNPTAFTMLKEGETVLDLGSGGGFDCFLAANKVGEKGKVIGVDMTAEMLDKARRNAKKGNYNNVEFRLGEIENYLLLIIPSIQIISNCVINLSTNKKRVFEEAYRVLKQNGKMAISDIVLTKKLPEAIENRLDLHFEVVYLVL
jgi:SAM-dependent methyltransferase